MPIKDRGERNAYVRRWSKSPEQRQRANARVAGRLLERQLYLRAQRASRGCGRCPERDPDCLDFHHRNKATKLFGLGNTIRLHSRPFWEIINEMAKCDVLCANCHRKEEAAQRRGR